ncbi:hypothetical protein L1887_27673 [Cichorium endivia]|nr:hypothetical protein L1887_27673 [Cichorium endivia]
MVVVDFASPETQSTLLGSHVAGENELEIEALMELGWNLENSFGSDLKILHKKMDPQQPSHQSTMLTRPQEDSEFWPLSGKPYFYVVLTKIHLATKFQMAFPRRLTEKLPAAMVSAKIICRGNVWDLVYIGDQGTKKFENETWEKFVNDNKLGLGDVCVFELMEGGLNCGLVVFKVQILRDDFPCELVEKAEGNNMNNPIDLD